MAITVQTDNRAEAVLKSVAERLASPELTQAVSTAVANRLRARFQELDQSRPNKQGWPRQHFWLQVADSVQVSPESGAVQVNHPALALRINGGQILPRNVRFLTIPAVPEAYGKRASDFGDLKFGYAPDDDGKARPALIEPSPAARVRGSATTTTTRTPARAIYWLARQAQQPADDTIMPGDEELTQAAQEAAQQFAAQHLAGGLP